MNTVINNREIEKKRIVKCLREMKYEYGLDILLKDTIKARLTIKFTEYGGCGDYIRERVFVEMSYRGIDNDIRFKHFAVSNLPTEKYTHVAENILSQIEVWGQNTFIKS